MRCWVILVLLALAVSAQVETRTPSFLIDQDTSTTTISKSDVMSELKLIKSICDRADKPTNCKILMDKRLVNTAENDDFSKLVEYKKRRDQRLVEYSNLKSELGFAENFSKRSVEDKDAEISAAERDMESAVEEYDEAKGPVIESLETIRDCEYCDDAKKSFKEALRSLIIKVGEIQSALIQKLKATIASSETLSKGESDAYIKEIDSLLTDISEKKTEVAGLNLAGPFSDYESAIKDSNSMMKDVRLANAQYLGKYMNSKISKAILRGKQIDADIQTVLIYAGEAGIDLPTVERLSDKFAFEIDNAYSAYSEAEANLDNGKVVTAREDMQNALDALKEAKVLATDIFTNINDHKLIDVYDWMKDIPKPTLEDTYVEEPEVNSSNNEIDEDTETDDDSDDEDSDSEEYTQIEQEKLAVGRAKIKAENSIEDLEEEIDDAENELDEGNDTSLENNINEAESELDDAQEKYDDAMNVYRRADTYEEYKEAKELFARARDFAENGLEVFE